MQKGGWDLMKCQPKRICDIINFTRISMTHNIDMAGLNVCTLIIVTK